MEMADFFGRVEVGVGTMIDSGGYREFSLFFTYFGWAKVRRRGSVNIFFLFHDK